MLCGLPTSYSLALALHVNLMLSDLCCVYRDCLTFAAEPVLGSLSNVLGLTSDSAEDSPPALTLKPYKVADVEVRYGLVKVSCTVLFFVLFYFYFISVLSLYLFYFNTVWQLPTLYS